MQAAASGRERIRFDDGWKFHFQDESLGEPPSAAIAGSLIQSWRWKMSAAPTAETADTIRVVPTAGCHVSFALSGPDRIAGVGNGDPSDHDPDKALQRRAFNSRCLAIVQLSGSAGAVTFTASSPGLRSATISLAAADR